MKILFYVTLLLISILFSSCSCNQKAEDSAISIIPKPQMLEITNGSFVISGELQIVTNWDDDEIKNAVKQFSNILNKSTNTDIKLVKEISSDKKISNIVINQIDNNSLGEEGYNLSVTSKNISIEANRANGVFYAFQTILQLLPPQIFSESKVVDLDLTLQCVEITDQPRFAWRGLLFDVARYFFPKEYIKKQLDYLAMHKMNVYHWHLTDDQGWRIEIKKYPKLTEVGAWRKDTVAYKPWMASLTELRKTNKDNNYGGYYTQDDIKEIVKYAADRFITIVPEIEMPGHCISSFAAYPELSCTEQHYNVSGKGTGHKNRKAYCTGNEEVFTFLENVLTEVIELFPSEYIHIGGDEVNYISWQNCSKCQQRIKDEGLANEEELQSYFIKRIAKFVNSKGRKIIGWDEIMKGGTPHGAAVMAWHENNFGILAARANHKVIYTPDEYFYINEYQGNPLYEPIAYNQLTPLKKVYSFEPIQKDSLTYEQAKNIEGVEAALWTNFLSSIWLADYMLFPRLAAVAEVAWTNKNLRSWDDFSLRMVKQLQRYKFAKINYAKTLYDVTAEYKLDKKEKTILVTLNNEAGNTQIFYTLDGSLPDTNKVKYAKPFKVNKVTLLKAATFRDGKMISRRVTETSILASKATGFPVKIKYPFDKRYASSGKYALTDGVQGTASYTNREWQGYFGVDFIGEIDLLEVVKISKITSSFLQAVGSGIFFPNTIEYLVSENGVDFKAVSKLKNDISLRENKIIIKRFTASFTEVNARFIKIVAKNIEKCPTWHKYAGVEAFMFIDEITVE